MSVAVLAGLPARAGYSLPAFFVDHPTTNSREWNSAVAAAGGLLNTDVDFRAMSAGVLNGTFYDTQAHNDGVRLFASDSSFDQVVAGRGPGQGYQDGRYSPGEGTSSASKYLQSTSPGFGGGSSLTVSFSAPAMAVGLFTIDYFGSPAADPSQAPTNVLTLSIYSGQNGKGQLLGRAAGDSANDFQSNGLYFMGYASSIADIGSMVLTRGPDITGDTIGIGGILFADGPDPGAVPEPSAIALLCVGAAALAGWAAHRRRGAA